MRDMFDKSELYAIPAGTESVTKFLESVEDKYKDKSINEEWNRLSRVVDFTRVIRETFKDMTEEEYYTMYALLKR